MKIQQFSRSFIIGYLGDFGAGKSLQMLRHAFQASDLYKKPIIANFQIDRQAAKFYCEKAGLKWAARLCYRIRFEVDKQKLLGVSNHIICVDEIPTLFFSRNFKSAGFDLLDKFFRPRHFGNLILYTAQGKGQLDIQIRERTQLICFCKSTLSQKGKASFFTRFYFNKPAFDKFDDVFALDKIIYPYWASNFRFDWEFLNNDLLRLFDCYKSEDAFRFVQFSRKLQYIEYQDF
jgi:hypothetical protein